MKYEVGWNSESEKRMMNPILLFSISLLDNILYLIRQYIIQSLTAAAVTLF